MAVALRFADGSTRRRAAPVKVDSRYDGSASLIEPIAVELPCMTDAVAVHAHEVLSLRMQLASASETLAPSKTTTAYVDSLRRRIDVLRTRAPPVRPLPFINDDRAECFFQCRSGQNACYLDSTLQLLASMNALDCDAPPLWHDLRADVSRNISQLMHLVAEQVDGMRFPQTKLGLLQERARLRDIDEHVRASGVAGNALAVLDHILAMICAYRVHVDEAITYAVKLRSGRTSVAEGRQHILRVRMPNLRVRDKGQARRVTDLEEAFRACGQFFVGRDDAIGLPNQGHADAAEGFMYPAFDTGPLLGERSTILVRAYDATPLTSFPLMLRPTTQVGTINEHAQTGTVNLSQKNFFVLRSIAFAFDADGLDGVYSRFGSQWWRMTRDIEDVTRHLDPLRGKLPDDGASIRLLVYERYDTKRTEGYYAPSGAFVPKVDDSLA